MLVLHIGATEGLILSSAAHCTDTGGCASSLQHFVWRDRIRRLNGLRVSQLGRRVHVVRALACWAVVLDGTMVKVDLTAFGRIANLRLRGEQMA